MENSFQIIHILIFQKFRKQIVFLYLDIWTWEKM